MCWLFSLRCRNHDAHERLKNSTYSLTRGPKFSRIHWSGNALSSFFLSRRHSPKQGLPRNFLSANSDLNPFCWVHQTSFCEGGWITKWRVGWEEWKEEEEKEALVTGWKKNLSYEIFGTLLWRYLISPCRKGIIESKWFLQYSKAFLIICCIIFIIVSIFVSMPVLHRA